MPGLHSVGTAMTLVLGPFCGTLSVLPLSHWPLDSAGTTTALHYADADGSLLPPFVLEENSKNPASFDHFNITFVFNFEAAHSRFSNDIYIRKN